MKQAFTSTKLGACIIHTIIMIAFLFLEKGVAQQVTVSGTIKNSFGQPIGGVSVLIKGSHIGTTSDASGNFSIGNVAANSTLVFSFIGMTTKEVAVEGRSIVNVVMEEAPSNLDSIVVIGYGTVKKKDLTGAVASVSGEIISKNQSTQLSQALQGTMSGLMVTRSNGFASEQSSIKIRGITTINNSNPLVIVDGIPGSLDNIDPNDVENVSVLKDAASAAIYGSRAASGVILVTTKRAKSGITLNYNALYGVDRPTRVPENETAVEYMKLYDEMAWNDNGNLPGTEYSTYSKDLINNYPSLHQSNPDLYPDVDWMDVMLNKYAPRQSHQLSLNAGAKNIGSKASIGYDKIGALYDNRQFERFTVRLNNDVTINRFLSASIDLNFVRNNDKRPILDFDYVDFRFPPIYAPVWTNGTYGPANTTGLNYYPVVKGDAGYNNNLQNTLGGKLSLDFKPNNDLKISGIIAPNLINGKGKRFVKRVPYYNSDDPRNIVGYIQPARATSLTETRNDAYSITAQLLANYNKSFGDHRLNTILGFENYYHYDESLAASRDQYQTDLFPYLDLGPLTFRDNSGSAFELAYRSAFGRVIYSYKNKYLFQANARYDGSSRFAHEYRWGFFPSLSAGWVISEEPFMKNIRTISFLKVRGSWGTLGNDRIGNYPYQSTVSFGNTLFYQGGNITSAQTAYINTYAIKNISWETTESYDIGLDVHLFENRLTASADYYKKTTKDMLLAVEIPDFIGFNNPDQNTGEMYTTGWDLDLGWRSDIGRLKYSLSFNVSDFKSVIGDIGGTQFLGSKVKFKGSEFNEWYGYLSDGLYQTKDQVINSPTVNSTVAPGDIRYKDISGPNGVPDGVISPEYDRTLLGGSLPRYLYGSNIQMEYKNFDLLVAFQGVGKQNAYLTTSMVQPRFGLFKLIEGEYWSKYNTDVQNKEAKYPRLLTKTDNSYVISDFWLFKGAYFRLKTINVGYNLPSSLAQKAQLKGARLYASLSDVFSIDKYPKGYDPEGSDFLITKSLNLGISVTF